MDYFIGFDVGSSKTHALVVAEDGHCAGFGQAWGGNQQGVGYKGLEDVLIHSMEQACRMAAVSVGQIRGAGFGIAGYDFPSDRPRHVETIEKLGLSCPFDLMNDGWNGLLAGTSCGIGVNVTAGSGVNCVGRGANGKTGRIVGNGAAFGEFGGGTEIASKGLQMVNYAWMKRIPPTALTGIYLEATGAIDEMDLMEGLSTDRYHVHAPITVSIFSAARAGDTAALEVLRFSGEELGWLAVSVARQIEMEKEAVEVVQSGSVFEGGELISAPMKAILLKHVPGAKVKRLQGLPVVGPVILGMSAAGFNGFPIRPEILRTLGEVVSMNQEEVHLSPG